MLSLAGVYWIILSLVNMWLSRRPRSSSDPELSESESLAEPEPLPEPESLPESSDPSLTLSKSSISRSSEPPEDAESPSESTLGLFYSCSRLTRKSLSISSSSGLNFSDNSCIMYSSVVGYSLKSKFYLSIMAISSSS